MVLSLVLASCGPAAVEEEGKTVTGKVVEKEAPEEKEVTVEEEEAQPKGPQYGGTIRIRSVPFLVRGFSPLVWDDNTILSVIFDRYLTAPWEKGPGGSNENPLDREWYPQSFYQGELLENWEVIDLHHVKFKLREGVHYWNKEPVNGRELIVDDVIYNWLRDAFHPRCQTYLRSDPVSSLAWWKICLKDIEEGKITEEDLKAHLAELKEVTTELEQYWPFQESHPEGLAEYMQEDFADCYDLLEENGYDVDDIALMGLYYRKTGKYTFEGKDVRALRSFWNAPNGIWPCPREVIEEYGAFDQWDKVVGTGPWTVSYTHLTLPTKA